MAFPIAQKCEKLYKKYRQLWRAPALPPPPVFEAKNDLEPEAEGGESEQMPSPFTGQFL
jgi:hypothetical protein